MIALQNVKILSTGPLTAATDATATALVIDTLDYKYCSIIFSGAVATAAGTSTWTSLALMQGDTTSSYAAVSGFVSGTDFTITASNDTVAPFLAKFDVDLEGKKRYLTVRRQAASTAYDDHQIIAILSRADVAPSTAALAGLENWVKG